MNILVAYHTVRIFFLRVHLCLLVQPLMYLLIPFITLLGVTQAGFPVEPATDTISEPVVGHVFYTNADNLHVQAVLGSGAIGKVFRCYSERLKRHVALKIENSAMVRDTVGDRPYQILNYEYNMAKRLEGAGYAKVYEVNFEGPIKYMVMELVRGESLVSLSNKFPEHRLPRPRVCQIAIQMLRLLQTVHERGVIIYDIHLGNAMVRRRSSGEWRVRLIDPGMAFPYVVRGRHMEPSDSIIPIENKNLWFTCKDDDNGVTPSRRCDVQRILYVFHFLLEGSLPWSGIHDRDGLVAYKQSITPDDFSGTQSADFMVPAIRHAFALGYKDRPDYGNLIRVFEHQLEDDSRRP